MCTIQIQYIVTLRHHKLGRVDGANLSRWRWLYAHKPIRLPKQWCQGIGERLDPPESDQRYRQRKTRDGKEQYAKIPLRPGGPTIGQPIKVFRLSTNCLGTDRCVDPFQLGPARRP